LEDQIPGNEYFPLNAGSPAIDRGNPLVCVDNRLTPHLDKDQVERSREGACDVGAIEFQPEDVAAESLVHRWSFDRLENNSIMDTTGSGRIGSFYGANGLPTLVPGVSGTALSCDGIDDYVQTPDAGLLGIANTWTISLWAYARNTNVVSTILTLGRREFNPDLNTKNYLEFDPLGDGFFSVPYLSDDRSYTDIRTLNPLFTEGVWHHLALTKSDPNNLAAFTFYMDGVIQPLHGGENLFPQIDDGNRLITLCKRAENDILFFNGMIDEFVLRDFPMAGVEVRTECQRNAFGGICP
jgi:hypothetical protein